MLWTVAFPDDQDVVQALINAGTLILVWDRAAPTEEGKT